MKILYIAWRPGIGGLQTTLRNRILALASQGITAEVLFMARGDGEDIFHNIPFSFARDSKDFKRKINKGKYDFISFIFTIDYLKHVPSTFKGKILYEVRGWSPKVAKHIRQIGKDQSAHAIICIAKYLAPLVKKHLQSNIPTYIDGNTVNPMFHFIHPNLRKKNNFRKSQNQSKIIGFVGRAEESKNWKEFIQICENVALTEKIEMWFMCNPNSSHDFDELVKVSSEEHLNRMTKILGLVPNHKMPEVYSIIKSSGGCILSTSRREGLGNSILEPMACGLPVVSSDVPGKNEVITHATNGMLYSLGDINNGAYMVKQVLQNKNLRKMIIRNSLKKINKHYRDLPYAKRYIKILSEINRIK